VGGGENLNIIMFIDGLSPRGTDIDIDIDIIPVLKLERR